MPKTAAIMKVQFQRPALDIQFGWILGPISSGCLIKVKRSFFKTLGFIDAGPSVATIFVLFIITSILARKFKYLKTITLRISLEFSHYDTFLVIFKHCGIVSKLQNGTFMDGQTLKELIRHICPKIVQMV